MGIGIGGASEVAVVVKLLGDAAGFSKEMRKAQTDASTFGRKLHAGMRVATAGAAAGLAVLSTAIGKGVKDYETLISSTSSLQRQSKISAKAASLLVGQWQRYGVTIEKGTKSTVTLARAMDDVNQKGKDSSSYDYFKRLGISMADLKKSSPAEILELVRQKLSAMPPGAERTAIAAKLLGKGFVGMSKWINASTGDISKLNATLKESGQSLTGKELAAGKQELKDQADLQVQIRGLWIQIGKSVMPYLEPMVETITRVVTALNPWVPLLKWVAAGLAGFLVVSKAITLAIPLWTAAQWLLNAALSANPIGIVVLAIAGLVAAFLILWNKCDWFRNFWIAVWEKTKAVFAAVWPVIKTVAGYIVAGLQWLWDKVSAAARAFWEWAGPFITAYVGMWWESVKIAVGWIVVGVKAAWDAITVALKWFWGWAGPFITTSAQVWWDVIKRVMGFIKDVFTTVWPIIVRVVRDNIAAIKLAISTIQTVVEVVRGVWNRVKSATVTVWNAVREVVRGAIAAIKRIIETVSTVVEAVRNVWNRVKSATTTGWDNIKGVVSAAWKAIKDMPGSWLERIKTAVGLVWSGIKTAAVTAWEGITGVVSGAFKGIAGYVNDIIDAINWVITKLNALAKTSIGTIPAFSGGGRQTSGSGIGSGGGGGGSGKASSARGPSIPSDGGLGLMDNGGTGADDGGKGGILGGIGDLFSGAASWVKDLWSKWNIGNLLPGAQGGLFGNATGLIYNMAKDAIVKLLTKHGGGPGQAIIDWAKTQLGKPYVWGATGPDGYDCSGLIYAAYLKNHQSIPRSYMWTAGRQVSNADVRPADVGFFSPNVVQAGVRVKYGHVKMYAGNGQSIESTGGGVQMGAWGGASEIRTYLGLGGITRGLSFAGEGGPAHPEAVIPLTNARRGAAVMREAGLLPGGGGDTYVTFNVDRVYATSPAQAEAAGTRLMNAAIQRLATAKRSTNRGTP